jgi:hypothetical protein
VGLGEGMQVAACSPRVPPTEGSINHAILLRVWNYLSRTCNRKAPAHQFCLQIWGAGHFQVTTDDRHTSAGLNSLFRGCAIPFSIGAAWLSTMSRHAE